VVTTVKPELAASQWWYKLWVDAVLFQLKKLAHRRYKYAVCRVRRTEQYLKSTRLAEALLDDPNHIISGQKLVGLVAIIPVNLLQLQLLMCKWI